MQRMKFLLAAAMITSVSGCGEAGPGIAPANSAPAVNAAPTPLDPKTPTNTAPVKPRGGFKIGPPQ